MMGAQVGDDFQAAVVAAPCIERVDAADVPMQTQPAHRSEWYPPGPQLLKSRTN